MKRPKTNIKEKNKPRLFKKPKIGQNKFIDKTDALKNLRLQDITQTAYYKYPGDKKFKNVSNDRLNHFFVINNSRYDRILNEILTKRAAKGKKDIRERGSLFYFKLQNLSRKGNALPDFLLFVDSIFKYHKIRHGFEVITVIGPDKKVLGYTTIKMNRSFMSAARNDIQKLISENQNLLQKRNSLIRFFQNHMKANETKLNLTKSEIKDTNLRFYKFLELMGFEVYFTPETGYKLDRNFNYVPEK